MEVNVKQRRCWKSRTTPLAISCLLRAIVPPPLQTPLDSPDSRPGGTSSPSPFSILNRVLSSLEPPHLEIIIVRVEWLLFYLKRDRFSQRKLVFSWQTMKLFDYHRKVASIRGSNSLWKASNIYSISTPLDHDLRSSNDRTRGNYNYKRASQSQRDLINSSLIPIPLKPTFSATLRRSHSTAKEAENLKTSLNPRLNNFTLATILILFSSFC